MGNVNSQVITMQKYPQEPPRTKVLPIRSTNSTLRQTENGDILQAGGTLSRARISREKFYGSEPDLRKNPQFEKKTLAYTRPKKYKAPPRPVDQDFRTKRLYKTRIESKNTKNTAENLQTQNVIINNNNFKENNFDEKKRFYFGMDKPQLNPNSSDSDYEIDQEKILLRLRPHLPKKRLETPRFSPGSAWKLLRVDSLSSQNQSDQETSRDDISEQELLEAKIIETAVLRSEIYLQDKSGDSGISGDDSPKTFNKYGKEKSWTPQQDLGNDSSIDDETTSTPSFTFPHIFSLSLPRERDLNKSILTGLRVPDLFETSFQNTNWFLSKSAPNSLNNGFNSLEDESRRRKGRIMYLPSGNPTNVSNPIEKTNHKKFSFQNTIRQIERRKLAEKLGREVEIRELQRLQEIEIMRKTEEEFRRKRSQHKT
ncbi:uncharacterized protein [Onthophagus taurus]|uniref:uncharacterized protein n=1 Tax=Onthophagus taurus TaxID=166361 RepID=UPI0039BE48AD